MLGGCRLRRVCLQCAGRRGREAHQGVHDDRLQRKVPAAGQIVGQIRPRPLFAEQPLQEGGGIGYRVVPLGP